MIYTLTFNPTLDLKFNVKNFSFDKLSRYSNEAISVGGKGINVSLVLKELNTQSTALGFIGGFTGKHLLKILNNKIKHNFINIKENTRINIKISSKKEIEINGLGPKITNETFKKLEKQIRKIKSNSILIISGSQPNNQKEAYKKIAKIAQQKKIFIIADTNNKALLNVIKFRPFLIKPNKVETEEILKFKINNRKDVMKAIDKLKNMGAKNILLSIGSKGAYLAINNKVYFAKGLKGKVENTIGSGDSMLAGFISEWIKHNNPLESLRVAIAAGSSTTFSKNLGTIKQINVLKKQVKIIEI